MVEFASAVLGCSVAVFVAVLYETTAGTTVLPGPVSLNVAPVIVATFTFSLKVAVTAVLTATPVAPGAGVRPVTVGAVVSAPMEVSNTTSTQ